MGRDWKDLDLLQWLPLLFLTVMILNEANTDDFIFCGKINHTHRPRALNITWKNSTGCNIQIESKNRNIIINAPLTKACEGGTMKDNLQNSSKICIKWHRANHSLIVWYGPKQYKHCQNVTRILKCRFYVLEKSKSQGCGQKPYICWENAILNRTNLTLAWFYKFHGFSSDCGDLDNWDLNVNNTKNVSVDNYMSATNTFMTFCKCKHNCGKILTSLELLILNAANKKGRRVLSKGKIRAIVINEDNIFDELVINSRDFLKEGINESKFSIKLPGTILDKVQQYPRQQRKFLFLSIRSASLFQDNSESQLLHDIILGIMVENAKIVNLSNPVVLTFWHNSSTNNSKNTCVFWNMEQDGNGRWNTYGCVTTNEENKTICQCNHLTYFAVLMKISADAIDQAVLDSLTYITYIGCTITVLSCGATLIILYKSLGMKRSNSSHQGKYTVQVLTHLILAVLLLNGNFLLSGVLIYISNDIVCRIGAMCLHSSLLATLTWMGIVGFNLYKQVVKVFNTYETLYIRKLCIIGWGIPAIVTLIILLSKGYGKYEVKTSQSDKKTSMCWIVIPIIHYVTNIGYFGIIFIFNIIMFIVVMQKAKRVTSEKQKNVMKKSCAIVGLTSILGIIWGLTFFSFGHMLLPQIYLFTILNSLQGFFILLWSCHLRHQTGTTSSTNSTNQTSVSK